MSRFEIYSDKKGEYQWRFKASSGELIRGSDKIFSTKIDCIKDLDANEKVTEQILKLLYTYTFRNPLKTDEYVRDSKEIALLICNRFKDYIENNKGYELIYIGKEPRDEPIVQKYFHSFAVSFCEAYNIDISPETDSGRGSVDFKMSRGNDKTVVEIKLTSNTSLIHGYEVQVEEYAKAEKTNKKIFLVFDNGGPKIRLQELQKLHEKEQDSTVKTDLIIIDAKPKESASVYKPQDH